MGRPLAAWLLGLWLGLVLASWAVATVAFRTADRITVAALADAPSRLAASSAEDRRALLRHMAAEINRWMFRWGSAAQVAIGLLSLAVVWRGPLALRVFVAAAAAVAVLQAAVLGPAIEAVGRPLDFVPRPLAPDVARRFGLLHGGYVVLDLLKAALLAAAAAICGRR